MKFLNEVGNDFYVPKIKAYHFIMIVSVVGRAVVAVKVVVVVHIVTIIVKDVLVKGMRGGFYCF